MSRRHLSFHLLLAFLLGTLCAQAAPSGRIEGGKGVGAVRLGQNEQQVVRLLGRPAKVTPSPNDPNSKLMDYPSQGFSVFMGSSGGVIGVMVSGSSWRTPEGIGVGSTQAQVTGLFGPGLARGGGNLTYASRGLAFSFQGGKVQTVYVVQREDERPLLGDRLIEPGRRIGEIRLGDPIARVESAWGRADSVFPLDQASGRTVYLYKEEALGLVVFSGRIEAMRLQTGDFITREGVKVGSSRSEVLRAFGRTYRSEPDRLLYEVRGIGFWFQGDRVKEIQVVSGRSSAPRR